MIFFNAPRDSYYCSYRDTSGIRRQFSCGTKNRKQAERYATQRLQEVSVAKEARTVHALRLSVFAREYLTAKATVLKPSTQRVIRDAFRQLTSRYGDLNLPEITLELAEGFINTGQPSGFTARRHYGHLKAAFKWAEEHGRIAQNPFCFAKPKLPPLQMEYLNLEEFNAAYAQLPELDYHERRFKRFVLVAFETGLRLSEMLHIQQDWIIEEKRLLIVRSEMDVFRTKSDKSRAVPLSDRAAQALTDQLRENKCHRVKRIRESAFLFPNQAGKPFVPGLIQHKFKKDVVRTYFLDRPKLRFHSLRHSFGSRLAQAGVPLREVQKAMGHSTITQTEKYAHLEMEVYNFIPDVLNRQ